MPYCQEKHALVDMFWDPIVDTTPCIAPQDRDIDILQSIDFTAPEFDVEGLVGSGVRLGWAECQTDDEWCAANMGSMIFRGLRVPRLCTENSCEGTKP